MDQSSSEKDHNSIYDAIAHDFICRYRSENVFSLKNPTSFDFIETLKTLKRKTASIDPKKGFLFVYISTHVIEVDGGDKENKNEKTFFAFQNSIWGKPIELAESSVSLSAFVAMLDGVKINRKTVVLSYAHVPRPRLTLFPSAKKLYPNSDFLIRLAVEANCAVIGSCSIGTKAREVIKHSPVVLLAESDSFMKNQNDSKTHQQNTQNQSKTLKKGSKIDDLRSKQNNKEKDKDKNKLKISPEQFELLYEKLMRDWEIIPDNEIFISERPESPTATWKKNETTNYEIGIEMPSKEEVLNFFFRRIFIFYLLIFFYEYSFIFLHCKIDSYIFIYFVD
jgi:hypothetical protein